MPLTPAPHDLGSSPLSQSAEPEVVVLRLRRHGRVLTLPVLLLMAVAGAAGYWVGSFADQWANIAAGVAAALLALLVGIGPIVAWLTRRITITTRRIIFRHGVFVRHRSEVPFARVREVRSRVSLPQRMYGSGNVDLFIGADRTTLRDMPDAVLVHEAMQELVERNYEHSTSMFTPGLSGLGATGGLATGGLGGTGGLAAGGLGAPAATQGQPYAQGRTGQQPDATRVLDDRQNPVTFW